MNYYWQQPIRPLEYILKSEIPTDGLPDGVTWTPVWAPVLFIRPLDTGWEIITVYGTRWTDVNAMLRVAP